MPSLLELANALRVLSIEAIERAKSGHPGMPLGMADIMAVLWCNHLRHNPCNPNWPGRDRFVLSNGHGSMLLYSALYLSGYSLSLEDIKNFRKLNSPTPGHPEYGVTPGVEATTGPLGQGFANAVGMALAEAMLATEFNTVAKELVDHNTYCFVGDGCLMEGISHEAASFAGTMQLDKLIVFWDNNGISIDGEVSNWCRDDVPARFTAYGWDVIPSLDGHCHAAIDAAITNAKLNTKPTLIVCNTKIGYGSPNLINTAKVHGAPLGPCEIKLVKEALGWSSPEFVIPEPIKAAWDKTSFGTDLQSAWEDKLALYSKNNPQLALEYKRRCLLNKLPKNWQVNIPLDTKPQATRKSSCVYLAKLAEVVPELIGGSADLSGSNGTLHELAKAIQANDYKGNYLHYGVREFGMTAIINGISLHGGYIPYGGTFLVFSDYARSAIRMSALMKLRAIFVYSHDSIGLGEDGPTHQPVEHLATLRLIPNLEVWRPAGELEVQVAWQAALTRLDGPTCIALTRQAVPQVTNNIGIEAINKGGYIIQAEHVDLALILIATGSELSLALSSARILAEDNIGVRVVSMPCLERFRAQSVTYQESVLPNTAVPRIAVEAGSSPLWYSLVGRDGAVVGIDTFGESAPIDALYKHFKLDVQHILELARQLIIN